MIDTVAILAGGLATRLGEITQNSPKSLVQIAGRPFIDHQLELIRKKGIQNVVVCVGHLGKQIEKYVENGNQWNLNIKYSYDGATLLGTGGALKKASSLLPDKFFVMYGDSYLNTDFEAISKAFTVNRKSSLMTVYKNAGRYDKSNVIYKDGVIIKYDKENTTDDMEYIDYGLSILSKQVLKGLQENTRYDLAKLLSDLAVEKELAGYEAKTRFYEVGSLQGILELEKELRQWTKRT